MLDVEGAACFDVVRLDDDIFVKADAVAAVDDDRQARAAECDDLPSDGGRDAAVRHLVADAEDVDVFRDGIQLAEHELLRLLCKIFVIREIETWILIDDIADAVSERLDVGVRFPSVAEEHAIRVGTRFLQQAGEDVAAPVLSEIADAADTCGAEGAEVADDVSCTARAHALFDDWQRKMRRFAGKFAFRHVRSPINIKAEITDDGDFHIWDLLQDVFHNLLAIMLF